MANNTKKNAKRPSDKRNLKYGSLSVVVTVIFVALVIILNVIATSLSGVNGWYTDMTASGLYSLSDAFKAQMEEILTPAEGGEKIHVNIVVMAEEDYFKGYSAMTNMIYQTIKELENEFDNFKLVAYNTTVHPELAEKYKTTALDTPALDDIVFELADENGVALENSPAKKYTARSFYISDSESGDIVGYNAEAKILSAIALLTGKTDKPTAYYLQGHGEPTLAEASDWVEVLDLAGFNVKELSLAEADFDAERHDDDIVIINCPKYDLMSSATLSEVKKIREFLGSDYGNMIVVEDANVPTLPALEALLSEWGLGFGGTVIDDKHSVSSSGAAKVMADYAQTYNPTAETQGYSGQILKKLFGTKSNLPTTIFSTPKSVTIMDDSEIVRGMNGAVSSFSLLNSYSTAQTTDKNGTVTGSVSLLGVARMIWELNSDETSYVVALSSEDFLSGEYESSCANRSVMFALLNLMWDSSVSFSDIDYKEFDYSSLTVSTSQASAWTISCVVVLPVIIAGLGVYVYVRRRHS